MRPVGDLGGTFGGYDLLSDRYEVQVSGWLWWRTATVYDRHSQMTRVQFSGRDAISKAHAAIAYVVGVEAAYWRERRAGVSQQAAELCEAVSTHSERTA